MNSSDAEARHRSRSPHQTPQTEALEENVYVLTLLTDQAHHVRMTELRNKYFPRHLNKLAAHLTLFHALPGSKLDGTIIPAVEALASRTPRFNITARRQFRLGKHGVAVLVPPQEGGRQVKDIRSTLQLPWKRQGFLSQQDATSKDNKSFPHYTIANKLHDEAAVLQVEDDLRQTFVPDEGLVEGLGLYLYDKGWWRLVRKFNFHTA